MEEHFLQLQKWIEESSKIVCISGPGISAESGIPDFRKADSDHFRFFDVPPEAILSRSFLEKKPAIFFRYFRERILAPLTSAEPNVAHEALASLSASGKLTYVITNTVDALHQEAGCKNVIELCGSVMRNNCPRCERRTTVYDMYQTPGIPYCDVDMCGAFMTPEMVLYGDALNAELVEEAVTAIQACDMLLVIGTTLSEYPAASLACHYYKSKLVLVNDKADPADVRANLIIRESIASVFHRLHMYDIGKV